MNNNVEYQTVAAVDLGSNSFHMIVVSLKDQQMQILDRLREQVKLAAGLDQHKRLSPDAQGRALACLERFGQRLRGMPQGSVRAVGTNTLRSAHQASGFLHEAERALGYPIEIIAGREEARLIYLGVAHSLASPPQEHCLVVDIGGGSTEFIIGEGFETLRRESLFMGCVSFGGRYFSNGLITKENFKKAEIAARLELQPVAEEFRRLGWKRAIGSSGTAKSIAKVLIAEGWSRDCISLEGLKKLKSVLIDVGDIRKLRLKELSEERLSIFPSGVAILLAIFEELNISKMTVSDWALREGLVFDLIGRIRHEDAREQTISRMQKRYNVDMKQAVRVMNTALGMFDQVAQLWELGCENSRSTLKWAAQLHEVGLIVAHNQYHKHGEYLLQNSDLAGFSRQEQGILATLVRGHRRKFPQNVFETFPPHERQMATRLCIVLRLAVLLHRNRNDAPLPVLTTFKNNLKLTFPPDWLNKHPLSQADLENEQSYLESVGFHLSYA
jgi:exopolyphosphatase / guanosine-5'-triphosphate,3'-diphosphate pyrophosphatase